MRTPIPTHTILIRNCLVRAAAIGLCLCTPWLAPRLAAQDQTSTATPVAPTRDEMHQTDQWKEIERHLPDPATATPQALEQQGDILRARRFPEDAMDYYRHALARGGKVPSLMNKLGLTELEMRNVELARSYFQRAVKLDNKDGEAWNNLGAVEFIDGQPTPAISHYKRAIKLNKREAVFHANLATAYFGVKDYRGGRREMATALKMDPRVFDRNEGFGGVAAHVLSSDDRARFSFEMARMYAGDGLEDHMIHSLAMASEAGMNVQREMRKDPVLAKFEFDPRVVVLVHNAQELRAGRRATASASSAGAGAAAGTKPL
jgi:tetratricopeptide (TPR) repeat protein